MGAQSTDWALANHLRSAARNVFNQHHFFLQSKILGSFYNEYTSLSIPGQGGSPLRLLTYIHLASI
ncbi:protein of unknown function [uncultured Sphingopyxis sp.]|uniref:Uncharacterized protein n=1 Tax=uncultured Sphingopyxis sp. TaxID=310581 RepID=A0A1Y5PUE5_9SPHN|nr:protein of unknown function [uncultured Sphingopyxis sp.]